MKKYLKAIICMTFSLIKFGFIKIFHIRNFNFTFFNLISPFTEIEIGNKASLTLNKMVRVKSGSKIRVRKNAEVVIGENTSLNHGCMIISHEKIILGKNVQLGPNVLIYDHDHDFRTENGLKDLKYKTSPVEIGDNVWISANVVILRGTVIGDNSVIGASSIVKGVYPSNSLIIQKKETLVKEIKNS